MRLLPIGRQTSPWDYFRVARHPSAMIVFFYFLLAIGNSEGASQSLERRRSGAHFATAACLFKGLSPELWDQKHCSNDVENVNRRKQGDRNVKRVFRG